MLNSLVVSNMNDKLIKYVTLENVKSDISKATTKIVFNFYRTNTLKDKLLQNVYKITFIVEGRAVYLTYINIECISWFHFRPLFAGQNAVIFANLIAHFVIIEKYFAQFP